MPKILSNYISVYPFSMESKGPVKFLVLRRITGLQLGDTWQFVHGKVEEYETAVDAAFRELNEETGFMPDFIYNLDPEVLYDPKYDCVQIIPAFAVKMRSYSTPMLSVEHSFFEWISSEEALLRVIWTNQRNKISEIMLMLNDGFPSEKYRIVNRPEKSHPDETQ
ncbi:MAG: NUDIX domain-containing protein [Planctomycetes bacterium]|nr:NUDIX domain-containing protein [Planctomycetota bacterium]